MSIIRILYMLLFGVYVTNSHAQSEVEIRVNLQGYPSNMPKKAVILSKGILNNPILILKNEKGVTLKEYKSLLHEESWHPFSHYYTVDFSDFEKSGNYFFKLKESEITSQPFSIGPYPKWQEDVVSFIRTQRCGFNPYTKEFCHQKDGLSFFGKRLDSTRIDATGGWHDAGDQINNPRGRAVEVFNGRKFYHFMKTIRFQTFL